MLSFQGIGLGVADLGNSVGYCAVFSGDVVRDGFCGICLACGNIWRFRFGGDRCRGIY